MRVWELFDNPCGLFEHAAAGFNRIVASRRFLDKYEIYARGGYRNVEKDFRDFLEFKYLHPDQRWGSRDSVMTGAFAGMGVWHAHLVPGKVILLYRISGWAMCLYGLVEHSEYDTPSKAVKLVNYIEGLTQDDFARLPMPGEAPELSRDIVDELRNLVYEMAVQDAPILQAAAEGKPADFFEFTRYVLEAHHPDWDDPTKDAAVVKAFGGEDELRRLITQVLRQYGH